MTILINPRGANRHIITASEQQFVSAFTKHWNAGQAAIEAGYSPHSASTIVSTLLARERVQVAIAEALKPILNKNRRSSEWVLTNLENLVEITANPESKHFQPRNAIRGLELLGKYHKLFTEHVEINVRTDLGDRILEAKQRARVKMTETRHIDGETGSETITRSIETDVPNLDDLMD